LGGATWGKRGKKRMKKRMKRRKKGVEGRRRVVSILVHVCVCV
jgi:hypothetical protein